MKKIDNYCFGNVGLCFSTEKDQEARLWDEKDHSFNVEICNSLRYYVQESKCNNTYKTLQRCRVQLKIASGAILRIWICEAPQKLLPDNTTINSEVYCHQLNKLNETLQQKRSELINRKGVVFHQDNARPHTSLVTRQKLLQLEWDTMPHPPYSPDLAPSDYYLFRSLQNFLDGKTFTSNEEVKNHLNQFFASKDQKFYERGIMLLPERWQKVLDQNGQYIIQ
ncbi:histone-lysine N-methyltransferase SETMAR [Trichonephila clavipes]|uniref:Histone-lysine N-methyltransferase SETMAR n=1 Tax=Trichonephila clavipes TaxID=2585209 RepID=A0A8X6SES1_TRICX|nr:histone-lysine N-methyltransferase SETMAR [Trichonephila clavipes]